jgi:hypothetical protein
MEPAVGDMVERSQLIHGNLYYLKFEDNDDYHLVFYDKRSHYRTSDPFLFVHEPEMYMFDNPYTIYKVDPENYTSDDLESFKQNQVSHIPVTMGPQVTSLDEGKTYYFYPRDDLGPTKGKYIDTEEVYIHRYSNDTEEVYVVKTADDTEHFPVRKTDVYNVINRNNVFKNRKTIHKMIRNKGLNRTLRNAKNIATNANNVYGRRKNLIQHYRTPRVKK